MDVCINESADLGIVISALEIVQPGLCGAGLATPARSYITPTPQRGISYEGKWVVFKGLFHSQKLSNYGVMKTDSHEFID